MAPAQGRLMAMGSVAEVGFARRTLTSWPASPAAGDRFVWYNPDGTARLWTEVRGDLLTVDAGGNATVGGSLNVGGGTLTVQRALDVSQLATTVHGLGLAVDGVVSVGLNLSVTGSASVGRNLSVGGSKSGYIVDYFLNTVGEVLEQGDVVVISEAEQLHHYGTGGDIPIPEVDLTDRVYDRRVCGIVAQFVTEADLPIVDSTPQTEQRAANPHPMLALAANEAADPRRVADRQLGRMATLGAFAHCKVDADIAPIQAGDLLTTSPTRGHAQKVLEPEKALGSVIGKALAPLPRGKGKVPILVMLQ